MTTNALLAASAGIAAAGAGLGLALWNARWPALVLEALARFCA